MKIAAFSDTHSLHLEWVKKYPLPEADVLTFAGDLTSMGSLYEIQFFFDWFDSLDYKYKILIAGNHDFGFDNHDRYLVLDMIPKGIHYLENSEIVINGIKFWGSPITPKFYNWAFMKERGLEIKSVWNEMPEDADIIITHGPPKGVLDYTDGHIHAGCQDLLDAINRVKPRYNVFGHIHEGAGSISFNDITFLNVSAVNSKYQPVNLATIFEI